MTTTFLSKAVWLLGPILKFSYTDDSINITVWDTVWFELQWELVRLTEEEAWDPSRGGSPLGFKGWRFRDDVCAF